MRIFDQKILDALEGIEGISAEDVQANLGVPPQIAQGDRALACFPWAKSLKKSPNAIAQELADAIRAKKIEDFEKIEAAGGYVNFTFDFTQHLTTLVDEIHRAEGTYGHRIREDQPLLVLEYSSPNIAKPFSIGHLRTTNLGECLKRIFQARGWRVVAINHLGDWGTQFGKLMAAYRRWGDAQSLDDQPIEKLYKLYVRFHQEEKADPTLLDEGRQWFARLEKGDDEASELWRWFKELTERELNVLYKRLGVSFDHVWGESFYIEHLPVLFEELKEKGIMTLSDDAWIADLKEDNLSVAVLKKSDESSLYISRDLAAAIYRQEQFGFDRMIYVVGAPQSLHFQQLFCILEKMGKDWVSKAEHVPFGHISFGDQGMSTRKGNVVFLDAVLNKAQELAAELIDAKNPKLEDKETAAEKIALGAVLFADVRGRRIKDMKFTWEELLSFEGETGPYLQYTYVRTQSLLRRFEGDLPQRASAKGIPGNDSVRTLLGQLSAFPECLEKAEREREPFVVASGMIDLARAFNRFYNDVKILDGKSEDKAARLYLVSAVSKVLAQGLEMLGIPLLDRM